MVPTPGCEPSHGQSSQWQRQLGSAGDQHGGHSRASRDCDRSPLPRSRHGSAGSQRSHRRTRSPSTSSSTSSQSSRTRRVRKAEGILTRHSSEYRRFLKERKESVEQDRLRRQGQILAQELKSQFELAIQSTSTLAVGTPTIQPGPLPVFPPVPVHTVGDGGMGLSPMQQRLAEAELEHNIQLRTGTKTEFAEAVQSVWYDKILSARSHVFCNGAQLAPFRAVRMTILP